MTNKRAIRAIQGVSKRQKSALKKARVKAGKDLPLAQKIAALKRFDNTQFTN